MSLRPYAYKMCIKTFIVAVGEGSSSLGILLGSPPLFLFDMLVVIGGSLETWCSLCGSLS